jgi:cytochrome c-type biogenesis protein CcmH/NrfG
MAPPSIVLLALLAQALTLTPNPQAKAKAQGLLNEGARLYGGGDYHY